MHSRSRVSFYFFAFLLFASPACRLFARDPFPPLAPGLGRIVIYRDAIMSPKTQPMVLLDGIATRPIKARSCFPLDRTPGTYTLSLLGESADPVSITLSAEKTVYVCVNVHNSTDDTELYPKIIDRAIAQREITACKYTPPEPAGPSEKATVRVLVIGEPASTNKPLLAMLLETWRSQERISYEFCQLPADDEMLTARAFGKYDVLMIVGKLPEMNPGQRQSLAALLESGVGLVSLHTTAHGEEDRSFWFDLLGASRPQASPNSTDKEFNRPANWMKIGIPDPKHPITRGIEPFYLYDSTLFAPAKDAAIHPVLTTDTPGNAREVAWTKWQGKSAVVCLQLGADEIALRHPLVQEILLQALRWSAAETARKQDSHAR